MGNMAAMLRPNFQCGKQIHLYFEMPSSAWKTNYPVIDVVMQKGQP
jgi:hypothetical protein